MSKKRETGIDDQLRAAIKSSGMSANQIAKGAGVLQTTLSRFLNGKDMGIGRAAFVARWLGLELANVRRAKMREDSFAQTLRDAIGTSGMSGLALAKAAGVPQQTISDFLRGKDMTLRNAHKLADYLGLELRPKRIKP